MNSLISYWWTYGWLGLPWVGCALTILGNPNPLYSRRLLMWCLGCFMLLSLGFLVQDFFPNFLPQLSLMKMSKEVYTPPPPMGILLPALKTIGAQHLVVGGVFMAGILLLGAWPGSQTALGLGTLGWSLGMLMAWLQPHERMLDKVLLGILILSMPLFEVRAQERARRWSWLNILRFFSIGGFSLVMWCCGGSPRSIESPHLSKLLCILLELFLASALVLMFPWPLRRDFQDFQDSALLGKVLWSLGHFSFFMVVFYFGGKLFPLPQALFLLCLVHWMRFSGMGRFFWPQVLMDKRNQAPIARQSALPLEGNNNPEAHGTEDYGRESKALLPRDNSPITPVNKALQQIILTGSMVLILLEILAKKDGSTVKILWTQGVFLLLMLHTYALFQGDFAPKMAPLLRGSMGCLWVVAHIFLFQDLGILGMLICMVASGMVWGVMLYSLVFCQNRISEEKRKGNAESLHGPWLGILLGTSVLWVGVTLGMMVS